MVAISLRIPGSFSSGFRAATCGLLLLSAAGTAEEPTQPSAAAESGDSTFGLRDDDARRIEEMLSRGESSSVESVQIGQQTGGTATTTQITVSRELPLWLLLIPLLAVLCVAILFVVRAARQPG